MFSAAVFAAVMSVNCHRGMAVASEPPGVYVNGQCTYVVHGGGGITPLLRGPGDGGVPLIVGGRGPTTPYHGGGVTPLYYRGGDGPIPFFVGRRYRACWK